jgi:hypothetical protein
MAAGYCQILIPSSLSVVLLDGRTDGPCPLALEGDIETPNFGLSSHMRAVDIPLSCLVPLARVCETILRFLVV